MKDQFKEAFEMVPWWLKVVWFLGVILSLSMVGAIITLIAKIITKI